MECRLILFLLCLLLMGCSQSGKTRKPAAPSKQSSERYTENLQELQLEPLQQIPEKSLSEKTVIKMTKLNGVYEIPTEVNGIKMHFIFDTGAGLISISDVEANFLYKQGKLADEDFVGSANFMDANGDISEGTVVVLREVKIGNIILEDVAASIVPNLRAPLLFGQSALEKFGKVSIDYKRGEITFEKQF